MCVDLVNRINTRLGKNPVFISDNGGIFNVIAETNKHINTSVYRSMANGRVERVHRTIKSTTLTQLLAAGEVMSEALLQRVINNYNNALNQAINKTPAVADATLHVVTVKSVATAHHPTYPLHSRVRISMYKLHPELLKDVKYKDSHVQHWSDQIYEIVAIHRPTQSYNGGIIILLANQADTKYYHEDLKLANESVALVANANAKAKPKPTQKTRIQKAEERELTWEHRSV